jgi:signal transduction histidine kinase
VSEWSVRRKVVAVLAIPVVLAAVFGGLRVSSELQDASAYSTNQQRAAVLRPAIDYLTATERLALPAALANGMGDGKTDARTAWTATSNTLKGAASSANLNAEQNGYVKTLEQVGSTLESGSGTGITADPATQLTEMNRITTLLITSTLNTQGSSEAGVQALVQSLNGRLSLVKQQLLIQSNAQAPSQLGSVWLAAEIGVEGTALDNLRAAVGGRRVGVLVSGNGARLGRATSSKISELAATPRLFAVYDRLDDHLIGGIQGKLANNATQSKARALSDSAIILLALFASLMLALFVARALIVPLRKVRAGALEVANQRLPETIARIQSGKTPDEITPIPVHSREELGQLARAVDDLHKQAVSLATGEAQLRTQVGAMFVTLSRRNTTLVNQQLALIESLEQDEEDPQRLEQLFSLDHLATRMRRTAESLVILGGAEGRTAGFEELSISDVIHAAVSEVQDYQRVRIDAAPDRLLAGRAASDVVHLMAELIDNALSYSPPGSPVTIQAAEEDGKVEIEIIDSGLGMAGEALSQANEALKTGGEVTVDTARRMGLFVVSRLAEEHGLKVKLRRNTNGGGIIAVITLPSAVLVSDGPVEHVSILDAPESADEVPAPVVEPEPEEEYDPYLERIEEAIAAVTGLPRRRPGQVHGPAQPVVPAASVGMFDAGPAPELPPGFEPVELEAPAAEVAEETQLEAVPPFQMPAAEHEEPSEAEVGHVEVPVHEYVPEYVSEYDALGQVEVGQVDEVLQVDEALQVDQVDQVLQVGRDDEERQLDEVAVFDEADEFDEPDEVVELGEADEFDEVDEVDGAGRAEEPDDDDEVLASVVTPVFGADRHSADDEAYGEAYGEEDGEETLEPFDAEELVSAARRETDDEPLAPAQPGSPWAVAQAWAGVAPSEPVASEAEEPTYDTPEPVVAEVATYDDGVDDDAPMRLQIRRPLSATPAASALDGDFVAESSQTGDAPIFGQLRSNWLTDTEADGQLWSANEVDLGWTAAESAETVDAGATTPTGLPVRRPGGRLLPGGVSQEPEKAIRDPEAIRNRLAAHAAGVSRGRAAAAAQPMTDDYAHEETGPA